MILKSFGSWQNSSWKSLYLIPLYFTETLVMCPYIQKRKMMEVNLKNDGVLYGVFNACSWPVQYRILFIFFGSFLINKRLSFTGVSSALSVLFVFPVQALTDTFNYSFRCLVETKVYIFHLEVITLRVLKLPVILVYYVSSLSFLFSKNTFKTSGPTHKNI